MNFGKEILRKYKAQEKTANREEVALKCLVICACIIGSLGLVAYMLPKQAIGAVIAPQSPTTSVSVPDTKVKTMYFRCSDDLMKKRAEKTVQFECI